jgi:hypothetical protein
VACEDVTDAPEPAPEALSIVWGPNPFRDRMRLDLAGWTGREVEVAVFDPAGRLVRQIFDGKVASSGAVTWDGRDASGRTAPAGVYLLRVTDGHSDRSARIVRIR